MFRGRTDQTIDPKSRIILPVRFRDLMLEKYDSALVITCFDKCLLAYPTDEWEDVQEKIRKLPSGDSSVRSFKRSIIASAMDCKVDKQGRVLIPSSLKTYANLERDIVIAGMIDHFEIWNGEQFYESIQDVQDFGKSEKHSSIIDDLGF